jgi:hypothetical protein
MTRNRQDSGGATDLVALIAILAAAVGLIALGLDAPSLATVTVAVSSFFGTWNSRGKRRRDKDERSIES